MKMLIGYTKKGEETPHRYEAVDIWSRNRVERYFDNAYNNKIVLRPTTKEEFNAYKCMIIVECVEY